MPLAHQPLAVPAPLPPAFGLAVAIAGLTLFVGLIVVLFSRRHMRADPRTAAYYATIGALVASVLACVTTGNLAVFVAAWVISGVALTRLIGHAGGLAEAGLAMRRAAVSFALGDTALAGALAILGWHAASWQIGVALAETARLPAPLALLAALLLVAAAAARCALPPFAGWLLSSMTAPTPVSALMHAGLVNAGGFLLIRFAPVLEGAPLARFAAVALGLVAALYGLGIMAVRPDIKRALAGSTVSQMGFMILSCGLGAYAAALWHILAHGLFKAWLFLGSGSAIGMKVGAPGRGIGAPSALAIGGVTLLGAVLAGLTGSFGAGMVPLALGLATALATLAGALQGQGAARGRLALVLAGIGLGALYAGGLWVSHATLGPDAPALLPTPVLLGLLGGFLGLWAWQQRWFARATPLPPALYIRLLNAGAFARPAKPTPSQGATP